MLFPYFVRYLFFLMYEEQNSNTFFWLIIKKVSDSS